MKHTIKSHGTITKCMFLQTYMPRYTHVYIHWSLMHLHLHIYTDRRKQRRDSIELQGVASWRRAASLAELLWLAMGRAYGTVAKSFWLSRQPSNHGRPSTFVSRGLGALMGQDWDQVCKSKVGPNRICSYLHLSEDGSGCQAWIPPLQLRRCSPGPSYRVLLQILRCGP